MWFTHPRFVDEMTQNVEFIRLRKISEMRTVMWADECVFAGKSKGNSNKP